MRLVILFIINLMFLSTATASIRTELIETVIKGAMKTSGKKTLQQSAKEAVSIKIQKLSKEYGTDIFQIVTDTGLEFFDLIPRYGEEKLIKILITLSPKARQTLAKNAPELWPLATRVGREAIELEAKMPGFAIPIFKQFGDDAGKTIAKNVPSQDIPRLLKYAKNADSAETQKLLLDAYQKEKGSLFSRIPPKLVLTSGLTSAMLYGTHQLTQPARALSQAIEKNEDVAKTAVSHGIAWFALVFSLFAALLLWRFGLMPWHKKNHN